MDGCDVVLIMRLCTFSHSSHLNYENSFIKEKEEENNNNKKRKERNVEMRE
jgi:hypothetical protein